MIIMIQLCFSSLSVRAAAPRGGAASRVYVHLSVAEARETSPNFAPRFVSLCMYMKFFYFLLFNFALPSNCSFWLFHLFKNKNKQKSQLPHWAHPHLAVVHASIAAHAFIASNACKQLRMHACKQLRMHAQKQLCLLCMHAPIALHACAHSFARIHQ